MPLGYGAGPLILAGAAALMLIAFTGAEQASSPPVRGTLTVRHQQIIVRIPRAPAPASVSWREGRGVRCIPVRSLAGASLIGQNSVDLILRDNSRIRARLDRRCPALDYYRGFYIDTTADGRICAARDSIRSRAGGECQIEQFRALLPERD